MTVGNIGTVYRRYPGRQPLASPNARVDACRPCQQGDCTRCTAVLDGCRLVQGLAPTNPCCTHSCTKAT